MHAVTGKVYEYVRKNAQGEAENDRKTENGKV